MTAIAERVLRDFPLRRDNPLFPPSGYEEIRAVEPVCPVRLPTGKQPWILTRYADVPHLAFGHGAHSCFGATFARAEIESATFGVEHMFVTW